MWTRACNGASRATRASLLPTYVLPVGIAESSRSRRGVVAESLGLDLFLIGRNGGVVAESLRSRNADHLDVREPD